VSVERQIGNQYTNTHLCQEFAPKTSRVFLDLPRILLHPSWWESIPIFTLNRPIIPDRASQNRDVQLHVSSQNINLVNEEDREVRQGRE